MRLNRLDLNQLQVLNSLLIERSATRVAERIGLTQPAVSATLRRLRDLFGDPLFIQSGGQMIPTAFAQTLSGPIREMLLQAELISLMRPEQRIDMLQRTIRICLSDYAAGVVLAPVIRAATTGA